MGIRSSRRNGEYLNILMNKIVIRVAAEIKVQNVSKVYEGSERDVEAIKDVSFEVSKKEFVSIVGSSGCGKSTLLRIVMGLIPPTKGRVIVKGKEVVHPVKEMSMGFQSPTLLMWRTVLDNVLLPIELLNLSKDLYKKRATDLLELVGLKGFEQNYPYELSGGMQTRVGVCRCLITDPPIILFDEPFGPLDALTRLTLDVELLKIWQKTGKTILFVTHDISEAVFLSDKVVILSNRPASVDEVLKIDLKRPRSLHQRNTRKFDDYCTFILKKLGVEGA